jgi:hypothetical protein
MRVLDVEDGHLAFDDAGVGAGTPGRQAFVEDLRGDAAVRIILGSRGKSPGGSRWCGERPGVFE